MQYFIEQGIGLLIYLAFMLPLAMAFRALIFFVRGSIIAFNVFKIVREEFKK